MATPQFKVGDSVQLKSGGPEMTVTGISEIGRLSYHTKWFSGKKLEAGQFPAEALQVPKTSKGAIADS